MTVAIRPSRLEDAASIFELRVDPRLSGMQYRPSWLEYPEQYIEKSIAHSAASIPLFKCWTVLLDGDFCGHITETIKHSYSGDVVVSLGWNIVPEQWGKGVAPRAIQLLLENNFEKYEAVQFVAMCFQSNSRCRRVLAKLGFLEETPTLAEKFSNWLLTFGRERLTKYRITQLEFDLLNKTPMPRRS